MGIWLTLGESWHSASSAGDKVTQCNTQSWIHIRDTSASYFGSSKYIIWLKIWTLKSRKRRSSSSFGLILRFFDCFKFMIPTPTCTRGYHAPLPPARVSSWSMACLCVLGHVVHACTRTWRDDTKNRKNASSQGFCTRGVVCVIITTEVNAWMLEI